MDPILVDQLANLGIFPDTGSVASDGSNIQVIPQISQPFNTLMQSFGTLLRPAPMQTFPQYGYYGNPQVSQSKCPSAWPWLLVGLAVGYVFARS